MNFTSITLITQTDWSFEETTANRIVLFKDLNNKLVLESESASSPYSFTADAARTKIAHGAYKWQAFLDDVFVDRGVKNILPNLETDDPRGEWTIIHENLMTAYKALSSREVDEITLYDGTHVSYIDLEKLEARITRAKIKMDKENGYTKPTVFVSNFLVNG